MKRCGGKSPASATQVDTHLLRRLDSRLLPEQRGCAGGQVGPLRQSVQQQHQQQHAAQHTGAQSLLHSAMHVETP